jgi:serine/threonine protein kinase
MNIFNNAKKSKSGSGSKKLQPGTAARHPSPGEWQTGDLILGRYKIREIIKGGMGIIYITHDTILDKSWTRNFVPSQDFAIKTFQDTFLGNQAARDRFVTEAETWVSLERHSNIVFANFVTRIEGKPYIFLEYLDGGDLYHYLGKLPVPAVLDCAIQICCGMDYAYKKLGVIHRDLKPSNIIGHNIQPMLKLLRENNKGRFQMKAHYKEWKVTDFGLVKAVQPGGLSIQESIPAAISQGMGTWQYMPPEQFSAFTQQQHNYNQGEVTTRSDIYSFGVTLFHVITGKLPFNNVDEIYGKNTPEIQSTQGHPVPEELKLLINKCMNKYPANRYGTFEELKNELANLYKKYPLELKSAKGKVFYKGLYSGIEGKFTLNDWVHKGFSFEHLQKHADALACYGKALAIKKNNPHALLGKAGCLYNTGKYQEALEYYNRVIRARRIADTGWIGKGNTFIMLKKTEDALKAYDKAIAITPENHDAWYDKGLCLVNNMKDFTEAEICFEKAITLDGINYLSWYMKAYCLDLLKRSNEAAAAYKKCIELAPVDFNLLNFAKDYVQQHGTNSKAPIEASIGKTI